MVQKIHQVQYLLCHRTTLNAVDASGVRIFPLCTCFNNHVGMWKRLFYSQVIASRNIYDIRMQEKICLWYLTTTHHAFQARRGIEKLQGSLFYYRNGTRLCHPESARRLSDLPRSQLHHDRALFISRFLYAGAMQLRKALVQMLVARL